MFSLLGAAYARAEAVQIDTWQEIGNGGWTWEMLFPYYLKSESMSIPNKTQSEAGASINPRYHGSDGPVHVGLFDLRKRDHDLTTSFNRTLESMGIPWNTDINSGHMRGFAIHPSTVDEANVRSDAARSYYWPYADRSNLHVKLNTFVSRIAWEGREESEQGDEITAGGVEIDAQDGQKHVIHAKKEVILSAGALRSPAILELSGIGNPRSDISPAAIDLSTNPVHCRILQKHNIPVQIDLPSVGENLQDQLNTSIVVSTNTPVTGTRTVAFATASDIFGSSVDSVAATVRSQLAQYANNTASASNGAMEAKDLEKLFKIQHDQIFNKNLPIAEFVFILEGDQSIHTGYWGLIPFARGNSHIASADPTAPPVANPNYGMLEWDAQIQIAMSKFLRKMYNTGDFKDLIANETLPGLSVVPENASDETWKEWIGDQCKFYSVSLFFCSDQTH